MKTRLLSTTILLLIAYLTYAQTTPDHKWHFKTDLKDAAASGKLNAVGTSKGISYVTDAAMGSVMQLDGSLGYVTIPPGLFTNVTDLTITCWFNWSGGADWQRVYSFGYTTPTQAPVRTIYLCPRDGWTGNKLHITYQTVGYWHDYTPLAIDSDKWYFTAFVQKGDTLRFYLNDQKVTEDDTLKATRAKDLVPDSMNWIGKSHWNDALFKGMITDLRFFKSALAQSEILSIYNDTKPSTAINSVKINNDLNIYSKDSRIFINLRSTQIKIISVYDITGRKLYDFSSSAALSTQQFKSGIYIVRVNGINQKNYTSKVVIR